MEPKQITVSWLVVLKALCETPVLTSTQAVRQVEVVQDDSMAEHYAYMTAKRNMNTHPGHFSDNTIINYGNVDLHPPTHKKVGEVARWPFEIDHIKDERYLYPLRAQVNSSDNSVNSVN